ncbi:BspA family leucine-rich repeat surface protein [Treponema socranskii]|uniref:BspA family leucine-rich repeat surface protein n=1 Tax=Treponema socranskii TaxID=53419 RepID=UPI0023F08A26|nr:BspA family leucine-rich repeat surface protein [Treponema socranskii]
MRCPSCRHKNNDGAKFCEECGNKLISVPKFCPECGAKLKDEEKFCLECGYNFSSMTMRNKNLDSNILEENLPQGKSRGKIILPSGNCLSGVSDAEIVHFVSEIPTNYNANDPNWRVLEPSDFMDGKEKELSDESLLKAYIYTGKKVFELFICSPAEIYANKDSSCMFSDFLDMHSIDFENFNTSKVINMNRMFSCGSLNYIDLSNFNTQNVTDMSDMFSGCEYLASLDLSSFDTHKVKNMSGMFQQCCSLNNLDLSNFTIKKYVDSGDYSKVDMRSMFVDCKNLINLILPNNISENANIDYMFEKEVRGECPYGNTVSWYQKPDKKRIKGGVSLSGLFGL